MYLEGQSPVAAGDGWQVEPGQLREFAAAVERVRANLDSVSSEVTDMGSPNLAPMLGTSPVGQEMAEKFSDRLAGENGLSGQLRVALLHMEEFLASAERTVATYEQTDGDHAADFNYS